jgi:hypothetical protein
VLLGWLANEGAAGLDGGGETAFAQQLDRVADGAEQMGEVVVPAAALYRWAQVDGLPNTSTAGMRWPRLVAA